MQAIDQINAAFQARDVKAYEALTTPDFIRVTPAGRAYGRSEWINGTVAAAGPPRAEGKYDQLSVRVYGNGAVVTYRGLPGAGGGAVNYLTRVMEKQGNQWKMALAQSTNVKLPGAFTGSEPQALPAWSPTTPAEKAALSAFQAIQKANAARDVVAWEKWSAADHSIIGVNGARTTRAERVAALKAPPTGEAGTGQDQDVRVMVKGDVAAVTWVGGNTRLLKVLARQGGQWQQVLQQASPIVAAKK
jgi:ketosteroid isomerase-like protein